MEKKYSYGTTYMIFVLGYDIMHDYFADSKERECDIVFAKCEKIYDDFLESDYNDTNKSEYECLEEYCKDRFLF